MLNLGAVLKTVSQQIYTHTKHMRYLLNRYYLLPRLELCNWKSVD